MRKQKVRLFVAAVICSTVLGAHFTALLHATPSAQLSTGPTCLLRYADISRDKFVFSYASDLWTAPREGGDARRLTSRLQRHSAQTKVPSNQAISEVSDSNLFVGPQITSNLAASGEATGQG
ncbi:MAG TPA: hypothetical protein VKQ28_03020 [Candidatus Acidoferrum sp.]|nr:hypothetical protein [Candidatus Acidoferrum sp.]